MTKKRTSYPPPPPPLEKGNLYNTKPIDISNKSTNSTTEPEEPSSQGTHEADDVEDCHKGEKGPNEDDPIKWWSRETGPTNPIQRSAEKQKERDLMVKKHNERYVPQIVSEHIDLARLLPHTPSYIRHQWDGTWTGLFCHVEEWREDLGLSEKMVKEAIATMGQSAVAIAILITLWKNKLGLIDKTPTAYLWGMIRKAKSENLNLPKTIYSLQNRNQYQS